MRVTRNMMVDEFLRNVNVLNTRSAKNQQKVTGPAISRPSDDPVDAGRILFLRNKISTNKQFQSNIDHALFWNRSTNNILDKVREGVESAQVLAVNGGSELLNQSQKNDLAAEVDEILEGLFEYSNDKIGDYYAFSGTTATTPFIATRNAQGEISAVTYTGNQITRKVEVLDNQTRQVNVDGLDIFSSTNSAANLDIFTSLINLRDDLRNTALNGMPSQATQTSINAAFDQVNIKIGSLGSENERIQLIKDRLKEAESNMTEDSLNIEFEKAVEAITQFQQDQSAYQAAIAVGGRMLQQVSLIDFL